jgi:hypothetical protein
MAIATSPITTSSDYDLMKPYWDKVRTILDGVDAMKKAGSTYLPQFPNESPEDFEYRVQNARFTNVYADIVNSLAAKPFAKEIGLTESSASPRIEDMVEDIDGRGNHLHVFAANTFFHGVNAAIDWIFVDYAKAQPGRNLAQERAAGTRPYWVHIPAERMLAVYTAVIAGKEEIVHARMLETSKARAGFDETTTTQVRVLNRPEVYNGAGEMTGYGPAEYEVYQQKASTRRSISAQWERVDSGPITVGVITLVPFVTGRRKAGSWTFVPALEGAVDLQIELYQQETALKIAKETVAFPMLAGNGVTPPMQDGKPVPVPVGPKAVLYAPPSGDNAAHGEWKYIATDAAGLKFLADEIKATEAQLRELGRQPLIATQGITVVSAAYAAQKATSLLQSWALNLKDALEQALKFTALWMGDTSEPTISWNLEDLDLAMDDEVGPTVLTTARSNGDLSQETYWEEMKRRSILSTEFDAERERQRLIDEMPDDDDDLNVRAAAGLDPEGDPANDDAVADEDRAA